MPKDTRVHTMLLIPDRQTPMGGAIPHLQERGTLVSTDMRKDQQPLQKSKVVNQRDTGD